MNNQKTFAGRLAAAYCRVSTDREEQQKSIQEQKKQWLEKFSETGSQNAQVGLLCHREIKRIDENGKAIKGRLITEPRIDGLYIDEGISGKSLQNRKAFQQMIEDAMLKKFDMIYVEDVSRFSRSMEDGYTVIKNLRDIGVGVHFRKEGWDSLDLSKDFELQLRLSIAQEENRSKSARVKWSMDRLRKAGGWTTTPPYGYDKVAGFLQINSEEAEFVRKVFNWYSYEMWGVGKIVKELNSINAPTKRGGKWGLGMVSGMLKNEIYTGKQVAHKTETYDITRHTKKQIDPEEWIVMQKEELRIISDDLFSLTQVERARRSEKHSNGSRLRLKEGNSDYLLLSGLLYCAHCGSTLRRKRKNHYRKKDGTVSDSGYIWVCHLQDSYGRNGRICPRERIQVSEYDIIEAIKYEIKQLQNSNIDSIFKLYMQEKFRSTDSGDRKTFEKELENLNGEMRQLRQDMRDGLIDADIYKEQMRELNSEIGTVKADLSRMERVTEERKHLIQLFENYKETIKEVDVENLSNTVLRKMFHKILVSYKKDENGIKTPTLCFIYKFLDTTNEAVIQSSLNKDSAFRVFTSVYAYKTEEMIDEINAVC